MVDVAALAEHLRALPGVRAKADIGLVAEVLGGADWYAGPGDDGAVLPDGGGAVTIFLDGVARERNLSLAAARSEAAYVNVAAESEADHTLELFITRPGAVRVFGVDVERDRAGAGISARNVEGLAAMRERIHRSPAGDVA